MDDNFMQLLFRNFMILYGLAMVGVATFVVLNKLFKNKDEQD